MLVCSDSLHKVENLRLVARLYESVTKRVTYRLLLRVCNCSVVDLRNQVIPNCRLAQEKLAAGILIVRFVRDQNFRRLRFHRLPVLYLVPVHVKHKLRIGVEIMTRRNSSTHAWGHHNCLFVLIGECCSAGLEGFACVHSNVVVEVFLSLMLVQDQIQNVANVEILLFIELQVEHDGLLR